MLFKTRKDMQIFYTAAGTKLDQEYGRIKANIIFGAKKRNAQIFSVLSQNRQEGKSTLISYLGIAFSKEEKRVLLIDGNFENPKLHKIFGIENDQGFSNLLADGGGLQETVLKTEFPGLSILPAGTISKQLETSIQSSSMDVLLQSAKRKYDFIFIDTGALQSMITSKLLAAKSDSSIIVVRRMRTNSHDLQELKTSLESYDIHVTGALFNTKKLAWLKR
ncbi:CpsD/CapB family tyrosine-protein kinase [Bacillus luteus]|uniref:CpsD/CapB family tyrosine-protein kinase n=2 Tax=Alkalicoccus luteus TaxID=1237094 RepID=A0A969PSL0_9BACI|nr:CpsD/CapB family tyrosine-protein kinase [Alkalicoccus luteus]